MSHRVDLRDAISLLESYIAKALWATIKSGTESVFLNFTEAPNFTHISVTDEVGTELVSVTHKNHSGTLKV